MSHSIPHRWRQPGPWGIFLLVWLCQPALNAPAQEGRVVPAQDEVSAAADDASAPAGDDGSAPGEDDSSATESSDTLRFSFSGTPWREVLSWLAEGADLALHVSELPTGSFTYSDPRAFNPNEAIERLNLFLIPQGYTLVRRDSLLSVISLSDPRSMQQLDAMAELVPADQLDGRGTYDVVKCIIPLGDIDAEDATAELSALTLMSEPVVLPNTNQLMVTDTVGRVKSILAILRSLDEPEADEEVIRRFELQHTDFESLLAVAGTHLGIESGQTIGLDISISADKEGKQLYITGPKRK